MSTEYLITAPHPRPPWWVTDLVLAAAVLAPAFAPFLPAELKASGALGWGAVILAAAVLPLRRLRAKSTLVALLLIFSLAAVAGQLLPSAGLAVAVAVFHIADRSTRRASLIVGSLAMAIMVLAGIVAAVLHGLDAHVFQFLVTVAFAAAAGDATRSRREYLVAVTERAERAEQTREAEAQRRVAEERLKIARDLHDAVAHQISVISLNAGVASASLDTRPERVRDALGVIRHASRTVLGEIGDLLRYLRAEEVTSAVVPELPQPGLNGLNDLVQTFTSTGLAVTLRTEGDLSSVTGTSDLIAYRAVQEGLTNAHKHGAENRAHMFLEHDGETLTIVITNPVEPGRANHPEATGYGHGLLGLRERVALVRGQVETSLTPGGHRLTVRLPITHQPPPRESPS